MRDSVLIFRFKPMPGTRFVRVSRPRGSLSLSEISAWPERPPGSPPRSTPQAIDAPDGAPAGDLAGGEVAAGSHTPASDRPRPVAPVWLAAMLVIGVAAGVVAVRPRLRE